MGKIDKFGWRQLQIKEVLQGREAMQLVEIAVETAMLCIDTQGESLQDAINFLAARDGHRPDHPAYPLSCIYWWRVDTAKSLRRLMERGLVERVDKGLYKWTE